MYVEDEDLVKMGDLAKVWHSILGDAMDQESCVLSEGTNSVIASLSLAYPDQEAVRMVMDAKMTAMREDEEVNELIEEVKSNSEANVDSKDLVDILTNPDNKTRGTFVLIAKQFAHKLLHQPLAVGEWDKEEGYETEFETKLNELEVAVQGMENTPTDKKQGII